MPEGGELRFTLSQVVVTPDMEPPVAGMSPGEWVCLAVSDSGIGMTEEVQEHLFEPFFTTKEVGKGTGLGLAQVYGTVRQHGGYIDVESGPGQGTTIFIYLPAYAEGDPSIPPDKPGQMEPGRRMEIQGQKADSPPTSGEPWPTTRARQPVILLVEADKYVRESGRRALESLGYRVLTAASGREALAICQSPRWSASPGFRGGSGQSRNVDVVVADLSLPYRGKDSDVAPRREEEALVKALKDARPMLKVIGIIDQVLEREDWEALKGAGLVGFVNKPLDPQRLAHAVQRALDVA
jgi:two-component system cell cycle sensor histidine kinase/response regulator CckA